MSTITKEWLQKKIADMEAARDEIPFGLDEDDSNTLAAMKLALASLEAGPVAFVMADDLKDSSIISTPAYRDLGEAMERTVGDVVALYAAPPAPVSVPDFGALTKCIVQRLVDYGAADDDAIASAEEFVYNACRAAMQTAPALGSSPKIAESPSGNSPVIHDGWVMVPVDMTPEQMREAQLNSELGAYTAANLTGAYSLFREFWDVAIAAAPKQE